jgi:bifunctional UDP-N-acetylglucosamine pyrophosphorylase/glucosamine-1-phosphate N-acetyltransferase
VTYVLADQQEVMGVNDRVQLSAAEAVMQDRLRRRAMLAGVTMIDPRSVTLSHDTRFGRDVLIEPHCVFDVGVTLADKVHIKAFCHLEGATVGADSVIGPYARLRPGSDLSTHVRIGNFVELKNAVLADGVKVNHLTYLGDASVGAASNIGAGTITCNYDGFNKHKTRIGANAFIGSNSALIAPVEIGDGAYVATGSVITDDVPDDGLALARSRQTVKAGGGAMLRQKLAKNK